MLTAACIWETCTSPGSPDPHSARALLLEAISTMPLRSQPAADAAR